MSIVIHLFEWRWAIVQSNYLQRYYQFPPWWVFVVLFRLIHSVIHTKHSQMHWTSNSLTIITIIFIRPPKNTSKNKGNLPNWSKTSNPKVRCLIRIKTARSMTFLLVVGQWVFRIKNEIQNRKLAHNFSSIFLYLTVQSKLEMS